MSVRLMSAIWDMDFSPVEKLILLALADWANDDGIAWPSIAQLARKTGCGERTVQRTLREAEKSGLLTRDETRGKGNSYRLTPASVAPHPRHTGTPATQAPAPESAQTPASVAPNTLVNTNTSQKASPSSRTRASKPDEFPCPDGVDRIDWDALKANRKAKRAALTEGAHRQITRKLDQWARAGWPPGPIVAFAAERGWTSVFETDEMKGPPNGHHGRLPSRQPDLRGARPDPSLDLLRTARQAEEAECAASGWQDHRGTWPALPAGSGR